MRTRGPLQILVFLLLIHLASTTASALSIYTNLRPAQAQQFRDFLRSEFSNIEVTIDSRSPSVAEILQGNHDLVFLYGFNTDYLVQQGAIAPLDTFLARDGLTEQDVKGALSSITTKGRIYHLPVLVDPWVVIYNRTLFDRQGMVYPDNHWTWSDFVKKSRLLTVREGGATRVWGSVSGHWGSAGLLMSMSHQIGRSLFEVDKETLRLFFDLWFDLVIDDQSMYDNRLGKGHSLVHHLRNGSAAMQVITLMTAFNWADQDRSAASVAWDVAPLPGFPGTKSHTPLGTVYIVGLGANSQSPRQAWEVAKFMTGDEAARFFTSLGYISAFAKPGIVDSWIRAVQARFPVSSEGMREVLSRPLFKSEMPEYPLVVELRNLTPDLKSGASSRQDALEAIDNLRRELITH